MAVVVNPTGDLEYSENEGKVVASYFQPQAHPPLSQQQATPGAVLAALKGRTHWHFACSNFSPSDARSSGLIMHGGERLSVDRLLAADGLGWPRLVVLSACESGLHDINCNPDEFIGLPGAFAALGAAGVLSTLWPVDDLASTLLIARMYELHKSEAGLAPPTALWQAQHWLRTASRADLVAYARGLAGQGRIEAVHVAEIERRLSMAGLERPYGHHFYRAGFIYTGA